MYYRLVLRQGVSMINMRHVREVALRGAVLTIYHPPTTDGRGWAGHGIHKNEKEYTFDKIESAKIEFGNIQRFLESRATLLG